MQKSDIISLIQSRYSKAVHSELLAMLSVSKLVVLDKGEEFTMYASASGVNYSLSVLNNGIAWIIGNQEELDAVTVANDAYTTVVVVNGSKVTMVFMHGMAEFTVADYTGVYQYHIFASDKCDALEGDLREITDYRYLNKMSLEPNEPEEIPSTVNEGVVTKADLVLMHLKNGEFGTHYRLETKMIDISNPHQVVKDLVNGKSILSYSSNIAASQNTRVILVSNDPRTYIIIKKIPDGGQLAVLINPTHFYYDGPSQIIQKYEASCIVNLSTLLNWISDL